MSFAQDAYIPKGCEYRQRHHVGQPEEDQCRQAEHTFIAGGCCASFRRSGLGSGRIHVGATFFTVLLGQRSTRRQQVFHLGATLHSGWTNRSFEVTPRRWCGTTLRIGDYLVGVQGRAVRLEKLCLSVHSDRSVQSVKHGDPACVKWSTKISSLCHRSHEWHPLPRRSKPPLAGHAISTARCKTGQGTGSPCQGDQAGAVTGFALCGLPAPFHRAQDILPRRRIAAMPICL